jgi:hypothetical protein
VHLFKHIWICIYVYTNMYIHIYTYHYSIKIKTWQCIIKYISIHTKSTNWNQTKIK